MRLFATLSCVLAALFGALAIYLHAETLQTIVNYMTAVWLLSSVLISGWVGRNWRAVWKKMDVPIAQIYRQARAGTLPKQDALETVMDYGVGVLVIASMYFSIVT